MSLRYIITTHRDRPGCRLSKPGHWGNIPFDTVSKAEFAVEALSNGEPFTIEREQFNLKLSEFRPC